MKQNSTMVMLAVVGPFGGEKLIVFLTVRLAIYGGSRSSMFCKQSPRSLAKKEYSLQ
jgi:hypothetical protein